MKIRIHIPESCCNYYKPFEEIPEPLNGELWGKFYALTQKMEGVKIDVPMLPQKGMMLDLNTFLCDYKLSSEELELLDECEMTELEVDEDTDIFIEKGCIYYYF